MRRVLACALLVVTLVGCAQEARPEGIVENWLRSLNQGTAGRPDRYAADVTSQQVLPGWHDLEPGQLDTIEVGAAVATPEGQDVPFRTVDIDGVETVGVAHLVANGGSWEVVGVETGLPAGSVESGAAGPGRLLPGWPVAVMTGVVLTLLAVAALTLVRRSAARAS